MIENKSVAFRNKSGWDTKKNKMWSQRHFFLALFRVCTV